METASTLYYNNAKKYLQDYYGFTPPYTIDTDAMVQFVLKSFHEFCGTLSSSGLKVLEFGGGPSIMSLISLSQYADEIVFTDYDKCLRKEVELWMNKSPEAFDWSVYFNEVVKVIEGKSDEDVAKREDELRRKMRHIIPCDLLDPQLIKWPISDKKIPTFDVISSSFCIDCVCSSEEEYTAAIGRLAKLQTPGGHMIVVTQLGATSSTIGDQKLPSFPVTEKILASSLKKCGYKDVQVRSIYPDMEENGFDKLSIFDGFAFAFATLAA